MRSITGSTLALLPALWLLGGCAGSPGQPQDPGYTWTQTPAAGTAREQSSHGALWQVFQRYRGTPYRYGGTSGQGFDCSGFIYTAFREGLGQQLPRTTRLMLQGGQSVAPERIQPGDLIFFRIRGKEQHAGIYMGNGQFIHASTSAGVTLSSLTSDYWQDRFTQARRYTRAPQVIAEQP